MAELRALFEDAGASAVASYIQSGNVAFDAPKKAVGAIVAKVEAGIERDFGFAAPIVIRDRAGLDRVLDSSPYLDVEDDLRFIHVGFLAKAPAKNRQADLDLNKFLPDSFQLIGAEVHVHFPNGAAKSKVTYQYFERTLGVTCTFRNWRTVLKASEMLEG